MKKFVLSPAAMKEWPKILWVVFISIIVLGLGIFGYFIYAYIRAGVIFWYMGWCVLIALFFVLKTVILKKTHYVHMHHYTVGMVVILTIGYQSIPAALVQAFCNGMMIEGGSRWGYDDVWVKRKPPSPRADQVEQAQQSEVQENEPDYNVVANASQNEVEVEVKAVVQDV